MVAKAGLFMALLVELLSLVPALGIEYTARLAPAGARLHASRGQTPWS